MKLKGVVIEVHTQFDLVIKINGRLLGVTKDVKRDFVVIVAISISSQIGIAHIPTDEVSG